MNTLVITTFSKDGYHLYGKKLIDTWCKFWPENYTLRIYAEHDFTVDDKRVEIVNIHSASPALVEFKTSSLEQAEQSQDKKQKNKFLKTVKWCHKVFALEHALKENYNYVIFLDGDTYSCAEVIPGALEKLVKGNLFAVHFERIKGHIHYETGFIIFNRSHPQLECLLENITKGYTDGTIYKLHKSWDGFWFPYLVEEFKLSVKDLARGKFRGIFSHPEIKKILVHECGNKKYENTNYNKFTGRINGTEYNTNFLDV